MKFVALGVGASLLFWLMIGMYQFLHKGNDIPSVRILRSLGTVIIHDDSDQMIRYGNVTVSFSAGSISSDHGKYYISAYGSGTTVELAAASCLASLPDAINYALARAAEIAAREASDNLQR